MLLFGANNVLFRTNNKGEFWELVGPPEEPEYWENVSTGEDVPFVKDDFVKSTVYQTSNSHFAKIIHLLRPRLEDGWLDREGNFWGCFYSDHGILLRDIFNINTRKIAEQEGWVHIHSHGWNIYSSRSITSEQGRALADMGRDPLNKEFRNEAVTFSNAFPKGYPLALLPHVSLYRPER
jgi:hypothetical protein